MKSKLLIVAAILGLLSAYALCQLEAGSISGAVRDVSGAVIPGATVTATSLATSVTRTTQTNNVGQYTIPGLEPAKYTVKISSPNFTTYQQVVEVTVGGRSTMDAQLSVGTTAAVVEVTAGGATEVNTQTQELSQLVGTQQMAQLPSLTRNPYDFVAISGNVSSGDNTTNNSNSSQNLSSRGVGYSINGQRESGTEILLDGVENVGIFSAAVGEAIPIDSVQEYSVVTNNFGAEFGRASGGVVNVTSKTGTNNLHGSAWEFNRLSAYTANTYDNDALNAACLSTGTCTNTTLPGPKGKYTRNQFGFEFGGPIIKNKLFAYVNSEWVRVRSQATESELIPAPQFLALTAPNVQSYFATYGASYEPISSFLTQAQAGFTVPGVPAATPILGQVNFKVNADAGGDYPQNTHRVIGRMDFNLSDMTQMFFRFAQEGQDLFTGTTYYSAYSQYDVGSLNNNDTGLYSLTHSFTPNLLSNTKISFSRFTAPSFYNTALQDTPGLMFPGATTAGLSIQFPGLENYMEPGAGGLPYGGPQNTLQLMEDLTWTKGRHSMKFGGQFTYIQLNTAYGAYAQAVEVLPTTPSAAFAAMMTGTLDYYEAAVNPQGKLPCPTTAEGVSIPSPECEITPPVSSPSFSRSYRYKDWAMYAQDSFRASPKLTLNYGVRYEHYGVQHNLNPALDSNLYYGRGTSIYQQIANGQVEIADKSPVGQLWSPRWGTVAPRVGFAYDIFGDGKTSLRGGFGISYERNFGNVTFNMIQNPPAYGVLEAYNVPVTNSNSGPLGVAGPPIPMPPVELRNVNQNINIAQTQFWSADIQRAVGRNTILDIGYSGAHGVHLYDIIAGNPIGGAQALLGEPLVTGTGCNFTNLVTGVSDCLTRPNDQYAGINVRGSGGTSAYDALNVKLQTQNVHSTGLGLTANYTWSHSLDDLSSTFSDSAQGASGYIGNLGYLDPSNPKLDWGSSDYDVRQRFVVAPIWQTPWFSKGRSPLAEGLGGWTLSGIFTARGGVPFSAYDYTYNMNGYAGVPRIVPSTSITGFSPGKATMVGPNQFQIMTLPGSDDMAPFNPTLGIDDFGPFPSNMLRRNALRGPGAWNTDLALSKTFNLTERVGLQFRAEGFDVFNHHNLFVNESALDVSNTPGTIGAPLPVIALKGGLNTIALGGNHDERRFGQFSLRVSF